MRPILALIEWPNGERRVYDGAGYAGLDPKILDTAKKLRLFEVSELAKTLSWEEIKKMNNDKTVDPKVWDLIEAAGKASVDAQSARSGAREVSVKLCRDLEAMLARALDAEPLRGLPNLGTNRHEVRAARVRGLFDKHLGESEHYRPVLCLGVHGVLTFLKIVPTASGPEYLSEPVEDEDLLAEDGTKFMELLAQVLPRHVVSARATAQKFRAAAEMAIFTLRAIAETDKRS